MELKWEAVDIVRVLPRSEENHSVNGMELSEDGTTLYLAVGGNTNNDARPISSPIQGSMPYLEQF